LALYLHIFEVAENEDDLSATVTFVIGNLTDRKVIPEFIHNVKQHRRLGGGRKIILDMSNVKHVQPYPATVLAGYLHYFREEGFEFELLKPNKYLRRIFFGRPKKVEPEKIKRNEHCLDKIWRFSDSKDVHALVRGITLNLRRYAECEEGVIDACEWGINEIMDNVIQHSQESCGFIMAQVDTRSKRFDICVFDYGIGIYRSFKDSKNNYDPKNSSDAISLAIQEGVTRDKKVGQENGMWGLYNMANQNKGNMMIVSGKGALTLSDSGKIKTINTIYTLNRKHQATSVAFRMRLDSGVSVKDALGGYELIDLYVEEMEDEHGRIVFKVSDAASGTGTRESGRLLKNEIFNLVTKANSRIIIDFNGVGIVSSSFADEFIGKLVIKLGFFQFQRLFELKNMNPTIQSIVQRSLSQRMAESLKTK